MNHVVSCPYKQRGCSVRPCKKGVYSGSDNIVSQTENNPLWRNMIALPDAVQTGLSIEVRNDVGVNPDEWTTSGNWVGDVGSEDARLTYQGLCIKLVFGGEVTSRGLSSAVLNDIAVISDEAGLVLRPSENVL